MRDLEEHIEKVERGEDPSFGEDGDDEAGAGESGHDESNRESGDDA